MTLSKYVGSFSIAGVEDFGSYLFYGYRGSCGLFFFSTFVQPTQVWKKIIFKGREGIARQLWRKLLYWVEAIIAKFGEVHEYRRFRRKIDQLRFTLKIQRIVSEFLRCLLFLPVEICGYCVAWSWLLRNTCVGSKLLRFDDLEEYKVVRKGSDRSR